jgi:hypothetical protein
MTQSDFRVVRDDGPNRRPSRKPLPSVPLRLGELFALVSLARENKLAWLDDLADDPILVTPDLAEILVHYRRIVEEKSA